MHKSLIAVVAAFAAGLPMMWTSSAVAEPKSCDLAALQLLGEIDEALSRRAIEIVDRASRASWQSDVRLRELVDPAAEFGLGGGDVGRPLGTGVKAARALAVMMQANTYRYTAWTGLPRFGDGCAMRKVQIEFDTLSGVTSWVEFTFEEGRLTRASGWEGRTERGAIKPVENEG